MTGPPFCWCEPVPCGQNPCPTRDFWLDVEDSDLTAPPTAAQPDRTETEPEETQP